MQIKVLILSMMALVFLSCEEPASEIFADCSEGVIDETTRRISFPLSELEINIPKDWLSLDLEDERVETIYSADSALFARTENTLAISLSSSKTKFKASDLETTSKDFFKSPALQMVDEGRTK